MSVYNGERYLGAAIDSILAQSFADFEFVIVDDGSTDRSREIVRGYDDPRIRLLPLDRNVGLSSALNAGLAAATSELVARQDADDLAEPNRLERQVSVMRGRSHVALLGCRATAITEGGVPSGVVWRPVEPTSIRWYALFDNPFVHTSVMFRTRVVRDELGGFDRAFDPFSQDYALWCRLMERHAVANLADQLVRYRVLPSSIIGALEGQTHREDYRNRFAAIVRQIVGDYARCALGHRVNEQEATLLADFVLGVDETALETFLELFERLLSSFLEHYPNARVSRDFQDTLARQFDAIALRVVPPTRRSAWTVYAHALSRHPRLLTDLPWSRALTLLVLGKAGRRRLSDWRRGVVVS